MAGNGVVSAGGRLTDWVSLGVLAAFVPRDAVDDAVAAAGRQARRSDGKLPPHVMVYFVMALALFADDDYEEVAARLTETLAAWGCWDDSWSVPTSGGITQARQRLGYEPVKKLFAEVAAPVAEELTAGAFPGPWRLMAIDGFGWDAPDTPENAAAFGFAGTAADDPGRPAYPKVRVVTVSECASHAVADAAVHRPQRPGHDQAGQPAAAPARSMISLCRAAIALRPARSRAAKRRASAPPGGRSTAVRPDRGRRTGAA